MSAQGKKINLDFSRLSAKQASQMSSNTLGDIGIPAADAPHAGNSLSDAEEVPGLGIMNMLGEITKMTRQSVKIAGAIVGDDLAVKTPSRPSLWKRVRNVLPGLNP